MSESRPAGSPTARIQSSLRRSVLHVFRLTLPGSDLIAAHTSGPVASPASPGSPADSAAWSPGLSPAAAIIAHIRAVTSSSRRLLTLAVSASSDWRSADPIIRPTRILVGCSICSCRILASSASRTRWAWRPRLQTSSASHAVSFSASATEHSLNPRNVRTTLRSRSSRPAFPVEQPHVRGRDLHPPGDPGDRLIGQFRAPRREPASAMKNFSHSASPSFDGPVRPVSRPSSSPTSVQCSISSSSSSTRATAAVPQADRHYCLHPTNSPQY